MSRPSPDGSPETEAAKITEAVVEAARAGEVLMRVSVESAPDLDEGRRATAEECLVASIRAVRPSPDDEAAELVVCIEVMPIGEAIELPTRPVRPVILGTDGADASALAAESKRAAELLQDRFLEAALQAFGVVAEVSGTMVFERSMDGEGEDR